MALSSPPVTVAPFDRGRLAAGISASATTCTVSPIYKTVAGVRVKQGLNTTSGCAIISQGDFTELITYTGCSVDSTTKVSTVTGMTRGRDPTQTTAAGSFAAGTGRIWAKGAKFTVVDDVTYNQSGVYTNVANAFTAANTFSALSTFNAPVIVAGTSSYVKLPELTTTQRDALTPAEGMLLKNSTTGTVQQYVGGAWASIGTDATPNMSTTVAGKAESATVAEQAAHTAIGGTGATLVPVVGNLVTLGADSTWISGAIPTLNTAKFIDGSIGGLGSATPVLGAIKIGAGAGLAMTDIGPGTDGQVVQSNGTTLAMTTLTPQCVVNTAGLNTATLTDVTSVDLQGTYSVGAASMVAGTRYDVVWSGTTTMNGGHASIWTLAIGALTFGITVTNTGAYTDNQFSIKGSILCVVSGASGKVLFDFETQTIGSATAKVRTMSTTTGSLDTTVANTIKMSVAGDVAGAAGNVKQYLFTVHRTN